VNQLVNKHFDSIKIYGTTVKIIFCWFITKASCVKKKHRKLLPVMFTTCSRTPLIRINWDGEPSRYA